MDKNRCRLCKCDIDDNNKICENCLDDFIKYCGEFNIFLDKIIIKYKCKTIIELKNKIGIDNIMREIEIMRGTV